MKWLSSWTVYGRAGGASLRGNCGPLSPVSATYMMPFKKIKGGAGRQRTEPAVNGPLTLTALYDTYFRRGYILLWHNSNYTWHWQELYLFSWETTEGLGVKCTAATVIYTSSRHRAALALACVSTWSMSNIYSVLNLEQNCRKQTCLTQKYNNEFQEAKSSVELWKLQSCKYVSVQPSLTAFRVMVTTCNLLIRVLQHDFPLFFMSHRTILKAMYFYW